MAAIKRALLPPILKTVKSLTLSALGKVCRSSVNELKSVCLTIRYQDSSAVRQSGCFLANSSKRFRVMICIRGDYLVLRYLSNKKFSASDSLDKNRQLFGSELIRSVSRQIKQKGSQRLISNCFRLQQYLIPDTFFLLLCLPNEISVALISSGGGYNI